VLSHLVASVDKDFALGIAVRVSESEDIGLELHLEVGSALHIRHISLEGNGLALPQVNDSSSIRSCQGLEVHGLFHINHLIHESKLLCPV